MFASYHIAENSAENQLIKEMIKGENDTLLKAHLKKSKTLVKKCDNISWSPRHLAYCDKQFDKKIEKELEKLLQNEKWVSDKMLADYKNVENFGRSHFENGSSFEKKLWNDNHLNEINTNGTKRN